MKNTKHDPGKIRLRNRIGWGLGSLGTGILLNVQIVFFSNYLVDYVGLSAALVGILLFTAKLFDLVTDIPMGWVSDRTKSRFGRRRPYLLVGGLLSGIAFAAIFNVPDLSGTGVDIYVILSLIFLYLAFTMFSVPYIAIPSEWTSDTHERSKIMSWRVIFAMIATTFGATLTAFLIDYFGGGRGAFGSMSLILGVVIAVTCFISFLGSPTVIQEDIGKVEVKSAGLKSSLKAMAHNQPFLILIGAKFCQLVALACNLSIQIFFFIQVMGVSFSTFGLLAMWKGLATILSVGFWRIVSQKISKKKTYIICATGWALVNLTWLLAGPEEAFAVTAVRFVFLGFFASGQILMGLSVLTDTIEFDREQNDERRAGIFSSVYTSVEKLAFTVAPALSGIYLGYAGYKAGLGGAGAQPDSAITAIYVLLAIVPAVLNGISVVLLLFYSLDERTLKGRGAQRPA